MRVPTTTPRWQGPVLVIGGPTAAGKSSLAMTICQDVGGEIISADSVQVYRGFDVGSAKPTSEERRAVPHHLIDVADPDQQLDAQHWANLADQAVAEVAARGSLPVVVGGTGLYLRALLNGFDPMPEIDPAIREDVRRRIHVQGPEAMHAQLATVDPTTAQRLSPADGQRVGRALEVFESSGRALSQWHRERDEKRPNQRYPHACVFGVWPEKAELHRRIRQRVDIMLANGWVAEVQRLIDRGVPTTQGALTLLGYRDVVAHLENRLTPQELPERIALGHRQYAKRQLTWFRGFATREHGLVHVEAKAIVDTARRLSADLEGP